MSKRVLITGATGLIGGFTAEQLYNKYDLILASSVDRMTDRGEAQGFDLTNTSGISKWLDGLAPQVIIHTAAVTSVDVAEKEPELTDILNVEATMQIAKWCQENGCRLIHFSTDFVYDGTRSDWREKDIASPLSHYGRSKLKSEHAVIAQLEDHVIIRPILVYGWLPSLSRLNFPLLVNKKLEAGEQMSITADQFRMPTYAGDLAVLIDRLVEESFTGTLNVCGDEYLSVYDFALRVVEAYQLDKRLLTPVETSSFGAAGQRPMISGFDTSKVKSRLGWNPRRIEVVLQDMRNTISAS